MSFNIVLTDEARQDEIEAYSYYENIRPGLGEEFLTTIESYFHNLTENPLLYSYIDGRKTIRDVKITRFPFVIIFEVSGNIVIVYSVFNTSKAESFSRRS